MRATHPPFFEAPIPEATADIERHEEAVAHAQRLLDAERKKIVALRAARFFELHPEIHALRLTLGPTCSLGQELLPLFDFDGPGEGSFFTRSFESRPALGNELRSILGGCDDALFDGRTIERSEALASFGELLLGPEALAQWMAQIERARLEREAPPAEPSGRSASL